MIRRPLSHTEISSRSPRGWRIVCLVLLLSLFTLRVTAPTTAQTIGLLRDAETENILRAYTAPLFESAGLDPDGVEIYIVADSSINAFVAAGRRVFINTGLIMAADHPGQIMGVLAHETGHITGAHLARSQEAYARASTPAIVGMLLGVGALIAGAGEAGIGLLQLGQAVSTSQILAYSRAQEAQADQAAVTILDGANISSVGLVEFFDKLARNEAVVAARISPYLLSHPLSRLRISLLQERLATSPATDIPVDPKLIEMHDRMLGKLKGFIWEPERTLTAFPTSDQSLGARYARAYAYHKLSLLEEAISEVDSLIAELPDDPYFHELKGQIYFEHGKIWESVIAYNDAVQLNSREPLLRVSLGQALIATEDSDVLGEAINHLETAVGYERDNGFAWYQLAYAYDRAGKDGLAALATAERTLLAGDIAQAIRHATRAIDLLPDGTPSELRARDIQIAAGNILETQRGNGSRRRQVKVPDGEIGTR